MAATGARRRTSSVSFRYLNRDSRFGISRETAQRLADTLGLTEMQVIHLALADLAARHLPRYEPDEGQLSAATLTQIRRRVRQGNMKVHESLF